MRSVCIRKGLEKEKCLYMAYNTMCMLCYTTLYLGFSLQDTAESVFNKTSVMTLAYSLSYSGCWGSRTTWAQDFKTSLSNQENDSTKCFQNSLNGYDWLGQTYLIFTPILERVALGTAPPNWTFLENFYTILCQFTPFFPFITQCTGERSHYLPVKVRGKTQGRE
jgi:hypothetical protein